jgi:hypothetical protein
MYALEPMTVAEIQQLVGPEFIKNFQKEVDEFMVPMRKHIARGRPLSMGKETWEYAVADSIVGSEWAGAGNSIVDVRIGNDIGLDVKSVGKTTGKGPTAKSGEASMFQTYHSHLDTLFSTKDSATLWNVYIEGWFKKVCSVKHYYLLAIVKDKSYNCSICGFKRVGNIPNYDPTYGSFLTETGKESTGSWTIKQLADPTLLHTTVLKGKKRLEMRLRPVMHEAQYSLPIYKF